MKQMVLLMIAGAMAMNVWAQEGAVAEVKTEKKKRVRPSECPGLYIGTSTGINNNTGMLGFNIEVPVSKKISIDGGPGLGTWGYKAYAGVKYYLKSCQRGFAVGTGLTYAPGMQHSWSSIRSVKGESSREMFNKHSQTNIMFAAYKHWNFGKKYNRVYAELGWSVPLSSGAKFTQLTGPPMSERSQRNLEMMAPGGLVIAIGVSFGMY